MHSRALAPMALLLFPNLAVAAPRPAATMAQLEPVTTVEGITEYRLGNGLRVLLFPDATQPKVTVNITYFVGSRHEGYGESGMAHLLEHMVFKGTPTHDDVWRLLTDHGARFNGTTWTDRTNYFETLPATPENLEFALALEADRMVNSKIAAEDLATEFSVVRNEFEMGENDPLGVLEERMMSTAYLWHNYGKSTIGSRADIERVPADRLRAFYQKYYQPDNAMLVVAGKLDPAATLALVAKHFGSIPRSTRVLEATYTVEPAQDGERIVTLSRNGDVAAVGVMYHGVSGSDELFPAEQAAVDVLTNEPAGRLYKALVESDLAASEYGYAFAWADPGVFQVYAEVRDPANVVKVKDAMLAAIDDLHAHPATDAEVARYRTRALKDLELSMTDSSRIGVALSNWAALGDWRMIFIHRDRLEKLTTAQVRTFADGYLKPANRTVGLFLPTATPDRSPLPAAVDVAKLTEGYKGRAGMEAGEDFVATLEAIEQRLVTNKLPSGLTMAVLPRKSRGGVIQAHLTLHVGNEKDLAGRTTALEMVPDLLLRGTRKHDFQALKDELDRLKAQLRVGGDRTSVTVDVTTVKENWPDVLALIVEVLREPTFPEEQFAIARKELLADLEKQLQDPMAQGGALLRRRMTPYGKDDVRYVPTTAEQIERVKATTQADVARAHHDFYGASSGELVVIGEIEPDATATRLGELLAGFVAPRPYARIASPYIAGVGAADEVVETPDKEMAMVSVGLGLDVRDDDPDYPALRMVNYVLGGSAKSRLLGRLRQQEGLSYGAFSRTWADPFERSGGLTAGAICAPQNAAKAMASMLDEIERLRREGIDAAVLEDAKQSYRQDFDGRLAQDRFLLGMIGDDLFAGRDLDHERGLNEKMQALTPDAIRKAIDRFLETQRLIKVRAGDLAKAAATQSSN